ncbi:MAG: hypothetical protein IKY66_04095 [Bacteroidales bacterium]|nr:hypothetical protein [Bacteroidales bacterium]
MTGTQARDFARRRAKEEALRQAGIEDRVWSIFGMISSSDNNNPAFFDAWSETSFVAIDGIVKVIEEDAKPVWNDAVGKVEHVVEIVAEVSQEEYLADPEYKIQVEGLSATYRNQETFFCNIRIHGTDSYLKVFYFNYDDANLIYPQEFDLGYRYEKDVVHRIPGKSSFRALKDPEDSAVFANLVFVVTKRNYPFTEQPTPKNILNWIYNIPPDERAVEMRNIMII